MPGYLSELEEDEKDLEDLRSSSLLEVKKIFDKCTTRSEIRFKLALIHHSEDIKTGVRVFETILSATKYR